MHTYPKPNSKTRPLSLIIENAYICSLSKVNAADNHEILTGITANQQIIKTILIQTRFQGRDVFVIPLGNVSNPRVVAKPCKKGLFLFKLEQTCGASFGL